MFLIQRYHKKNLVVESTVAEFLAKCIQFLLNDLLSVWQGKLSQRKQERPFFLG